MNSPEKIIESLLLAKERASLVGNWELFSMISQDIREIEKNYQNKSPKKDGNYKPNTTIQSSK